VIGVPPARSSNALIRHADLGQARIVIGVPPARSSNALIQHADLARTARLLLRGRPTA